MSQPMLVPSIDVDAIKKQLKLLGHSLPTDVIVKFLQENDDLLTACQQPLHQEKSDRSRGGHTALQVEVFNKQISQFSLPAAHYSVLETAVAPRALPRTPELDLTWGTRGTLSSTTQDMFKARASCSSSAVDQYACTETVHNPPGNLKHEPMMQSTGASESHLSGVTQSSGSRQLVEAQAVRGNHLDQLQCMRDEM